MVTIHDPLNPPRGTQRVYKTAATDGPMLARAWADSGKVTAGTWKQKSPPVKVGAARGHEMNSPRNTDAAQFTTPMEVMQA